MKIRVVMIGCWILVIAGIISMEAGSLDRFTLNEFFNEQVLSYTNPGDVKVHINAPNPDSLLPDRMTSLVFFALPNGNSTAWTIGKEAAPEEDWHYEIQHIGAQTRFLRQLVRDRNIVTIYLEATSQSWPSWSSSHPSDRYPLIHAMIDSVRRIFADYPHEVVLNGHSGGGSWVLNFINSVDTIPDYVKRIAFLDSDYNYSDAAGTRHGSKLAQWLSQSEDHYLCVLAYNDSIALLDGVPIVSATGGTWYRSRIMQKKLAEYFTFTSTENSEFITHFALNNRVQFWLKHNPTRGILHTVQVERNGYIHSVACGTVYDQVGYQYYGNHAYDQYVQKLPPEDILNQKTDHEEGGIRLNFNQVEHGDIYRVWWGTDGINFTDSLDTRDSSVLIPGLSSDSLYYIRLRGVSFWGESPTITTLACSPGFDSADVVIINAYDAETETNTREYIRQHAQAFHANGKRVVSATNDALTAGWLNLEDYPIVDFIVGSDYYQDESISPDEQALITTYLQNGGRLLISGNDLAYDMDSKGKTEQKQFCYDYLKMKYLTRAPGGKTGVYYQLEFLPPWSTPGCSLWFDDGTHGTYNVSRPNAIQAVNGAQSMIAVTGVDTSAGVAGVAYSGLFPNGTRPGKVVVSSVPIETIYPDSARACFIETVLGYFAQTTDIIQGETIPPSRLILEPNYPNPFNGSTRIGFYLPTAAQVELAVFDNLGRRVADLAGGFFSAGQHTVTWESPQIASGIYFCRLESDGLRLTRKILVLK